MKIRKIGRWVAKFVAHLFATAALWVLIQTSIKKYKMGGKGKEWQTHSRPPKKYLKKKKKKR